MADPIKPVETYDLAMMYLDRVRAEVSSSDAAVIARRVRDLTGLHDDWRAKCLNLTPAENGISRHARRLLDSDFATRVTEGLPGAKEYPGEPQNRFIDEIEAILVALAAELFSARFVDWRPVSTSMANAIVFNALLKPGSKVLTQSVPAGGNYSYQPGGAPSIGGLDVVSIPPAGDAFEIDPEVCRRIALRERPQMIVVGGSYSLFQLPIAELATIAREVDAYLLVDAAHTALFMATGHWENALLSGADILTLSTHKVMSGPVGGMILTNDESIARSVLAMTFPVFMQTRDQNKYASAAHAFCEMRQFGHGYAEQMIRNAQALGQALLEQGLTPLAADRRFTRSHQLVLDLAPLNARATTRALREAGILVSAEHLATDIPGSPTGARLTVQEITRQGMRESDMAEVASLVARVVHRRATGSEVASEVASLAAAFRQSQYSFDTDGSSQACAEGGYGP